MGRVMECVEEYKVENVLKDRMDQNWQRTVVKKMGRLFDETGYRPPNWAVVQSFLVGSGRSGSTSSALHCKWLGFDPDARTFQVDEETDDEIEEDEEPDGYECMSCGNIQGVSNGFGCARCAGPLFEWMG